MAAEAPPIINDYGVLAICDTVHDFWKERARVGNAAVEAGDKIVAVSRLEQTHEKVTEILQRNTGKAGQTTQQIVQSITNEEVRSLTNEYEWKVVRYFEKKLGLVEKESLLSFEEIASWDTTNWEAYKAKVQLLGNCVELESSSGLPIDSFSLEKRKKIGFFILAYMNPSGVSPGGELRAFTFDAGVGPLDKIFGEFEQVLNYVFPQNIADSAPTSLKPLGGRCIMHPSDRDIESNVFSYPDNVSGRFRDRDFSHQNVYGFSIQLQGEERGPAEIAFSVTRRQGPSVNYIMDLMLTPATAAPETGMASLANVMEKWGGEEDKAPLNALLFDIKRMGDHEQVNISTEFPECYLATIDILCSLHARIKRKPCVLHTPDKLRLYRFVGPPPSPELQVLRTNIFRAQQNLGKFNTVINYLTYAASQEVFSSLDKSIEMFRIGETARLKAGKSKLLNEYNLGADPGDLALTVVSRLLNFRMRDLYTRATAVKAAIEAFQDNAVVKDWRDNQAERIRILKDVIKRTNIGEDVVVAGETLTIGGVDITALNTEIETVFNQTPAFAELEFPLNSGGNAVSLYKPIFTVDKTGTYFLKHAGSIPAFKFSCDPYEKMRASLQTLIQISRSERAAASQAKFVLETVGTFFKNRDAEKEAFYSEELKGVVETASDVSTPFDVKVGIPEMVQRVMALPAFPQQGGDVKTRAAVKREIEAVTDRTLNAIEAVRSETEQSSISQTRWHPLQYHDMDDLFAEICSMAAITVNSILSEDASAPSTPPTPPTPSSDVEMVNGGAKRARVSPGSSVKMSDTTSSRASVSSEEKSGLQVTTTPTRKKSRFVSPTAFSFRSPASSVRSPMDVSYSPRKALFKERPAKTVLSSDVYTEPIRQTLEEITDRWRFGLLELKNNAETIYGVPFDGTASNSVGLLLNSSLTPIDKLIILTVFDNYRYIAWYMKHNKLTNRKEAFDYAGLYFQEFDVPGITEKYTSRSEWNNKLQINIQQLTLAVPKGTLTSATRKLMRGGRRTTYRITPSNRRKTYRK